MTADGNPTGPRSATGLPERYRARERHRASPTGVHDWANIDDARTRGGRYRRRVRVLIGLGGKARTAASGARVVLTHGHAPQAGSPSTPAVVP